MLDELKEILGELYAKYGLTHEVVKLSQTIDTLINQEMKNKLTKSREIIC